MADFLRFKGAKSVTKQTGDEMRLRRPPNGGDTWQTKRWWGGKGKVVYITAAIFNVTTSGDSVQLVIPTDNETTAVTIRHDGDGNFTFSDYRGIDRIAVYNADRTNMVAEYQFPAISGGSVLKRTFAPPVAAVVDPTPEPPEQPPAEPTFAEKVAAAAYTYVVTVDNGVYELDGVAQAEVTANVGESIVFDFSGVADNHPLAIFTDSTKLTPVTVGVEEENGVLYFAPPIAGTFSYQCINHADMGGDITIS